MSSELFISGGQYSLTGHQQQPITCKTLTLPNQTSVSITNDNTSYAFYKSSLTNGVATSYLQITCPSIPSSTSISLSFRITATQGSDIQCRGGIGTITIVTDGKTAVAANAVATAASTSAVTTGTLSVPTFTTSIVGNVVTLLVSVTSSLGAPTININSIHQAHIDVGTFSIITL